jgi:hypothetical protein
MVIFWWGQGSDSVAQNRSRGFSNKRKLSLVNQEAPAAFGAGTVFAGLSIDK